jgi:putative tricarboxylic transport membrane protein
MIKDIFGSLFWLSLTIYVCIESYHIGLGKWHTPGPGAFPFDAAMLLGILSLFIFLKTLRKASTVGISAENTGSFGWRNIALVLAGLVIYIFLLNKLGFILCTFLLVYFLLFVIARQKWLTSMITSLSITLGSHIIFNTLLNANLPKGIFTFLQG